jgi:hypothetical protein
MIWHHFKFEDFARQLFRNLINDLFQTFIYTPYKHLAAILRAKDDMVFAGVEHMTMALEVLYVAHMFYYTVRYYLMSRSAPYIPIAKTRGFTAHFGKCGSIGCGFTPVRYLKKLTSPLVGGLVFSHDDD